MKYVYIRFGLEFFLEVEPNKITQFDLVRLINLSKNTTNKNESGFSIFEDAHRFPL
jgi:hypothetical protein